VQLWQTVGIVFFVYIVAVAVWRGGRGRTASVFVGAASGILIIAAASISPQPAALVDWVWPPLVLLIAYWSSGLLFVAPVPGQERALAWLDDRLAVRDLARRTPRPVAELLEVAYLAVYAIVPIALVVQLMFSVDASPSRFWSVVLITDFICFGVLPWVQTRPPRSLESGEPWDSAIRRFNLHVLGATSIHANTFPSGHAAEALAAALLVLDAPRFVVGVMFAAAFCVAAGAVLGRYHYLADALAGWVVAISVAWILVA
jgi:hypothetical protein